MPREFLDRCCSSASRASVMDKSCSPAACLAATTRRITSVFLLQGRTRIPCSRLTGHRSSTSGLKACSAGPRRKHALQIHPAGLTPRRAASCLSAWYVRSSAGTPLQLCLGLAEGLPDMGPGSCPEGWAPDTAHKVAFSEAVHHCCT